MEDYKVRMKDLIPFKGYFDYVNRTMSSQIDNPQDSAKATLIALGLGFYHFGFCYAAAIGALAGLDKLLS